MDDQTLRKFESEWQRLISLDQRKQEVIRLLQEREKLTAQLKQSIEEADTLAVVEDLYRPYRTKRQTRASKAIDQGLKHLADFMMGPEATEKDSSSMRQLY